MSKEYCGETTWYADSSGDICGKTKVHLEPVRIYQCSSCQMKEMQSQITALEAELDQARSRADSNWRVCLVENEMPDLAPGKLFKASGATCLCIAELEAENQRLRELVKEAYDEGWKAGLCHWNGGKEAFEEDWDDSETKAALQEKDDGWM